MTLWSKKNSRRALMQEIQVRRALMRVLVTFVVLSSLCVPSLL